MKNRDFARGLGKIPSDLTAGRLDYGGTLRLEMGVQAFSA